MKKLFSFILFLIIGISFIGCNKKNTEAVSEEKTAEITPVEAEPETAGPEPDLVEEEIEEAAATDYANPDYTLAAGKYYGGKRLITNILTDNAPVYALPDDTSEVLFQAQFNQVFDVINFSDTKDVVDGVLGYWVYCYASDEQGSGVKGWVHSKDINVDRLAEVSEVTFAYIKSERTDNISLYVNLIRHSGESFDVVALVDAYRFPNQDFYTFVWNNDYDQGFYTDPIGTFAWYPETNEIKHISFAGTYGECGWTKASDDQKYIFEDYGTAPGIRGLGIYDAAKSKMIYSGSYYNDIELADNEVTIVTKYSDYNIQRGSISEEDIANVKEFNETTPLSEAEKEWEAADLLAVGVQYRYNFVEDFKYYKGCVRLCEQ